MIMSKVKSIGKKASHWTEHIEKAISLKNLHTEICAILDNL